MPWTVELADAVVKTLDKLDAPVRRRIQRFVQQRLQGTENPRQWGEPLSGRFAGSWKYRVGEYRLICQLQDFRLVVLVVKAGHRGKIYQDDS